MPVGVGRFGPQNPSNQFGHFNQSYSVHQQAHPTHQNASLQTQNLAAHTGFGVTSPTNGGLYGQGSQSLGLQSALGAGAMGMDGGGNGLASHAAQLGFAHGAVLEQQRTYDPSSGMSMAGLKAMGGRIREVWKTNLAQEMHLLRMLVDKYPYISMDTQFPGVIARPIGDFQSKASYHYQTLRCNVDLLKIIQLGITLFTPEGDIPPAHLELPTPQKSLYTNSLIMCPCTWTFNFQYSLDEDMYNEDSISSLRKAGADFEKHAELGINPADFGSLLITSGLVLSNDVNWISFHSGYDFSYLVKLMWCKPLPSDEEEHNQLVKAFFPNLIDIKYLLKHAQNAARRGALSAQATNVLSSLGQKSGLQELADELGCQRVGMPHSAGSDSLLTGLIFYQMRLKIYDGRIPDEMNGQMWGLTGVGAPASAASQAAVLAAHGQSANGAMGYFNGATTAGQRGDVPSTPTNNHSGLASTTPGPSSHHGGLSSLTPGAGGVFGNFQYGK